MVGIICRSAPASVHFGASNPRFRVAVLVGLLLVVLGACSCPQELNLVERHEGDSAVVFRSTGHVVDLETRKVLDSRAEAATGMVNGPVEPCMRGWCVERQSRGFRVTGPNTEYVVDPIARTPGDFSPPISSCGLGPYSYVWADPDPSSSSPTLVMALGEWGAATWTDNDGTKLLPVGEFRAPGTYAEVVDDLGAWAVILPVPVFFGSLGFGSMLASQRSGRRNVKLAAFATLAAVVAVVVLAALVAHRIMGAAFWLPPIVGIVVAGLATVGIAASDRAPTSSPTDVRL